MKYKGNSRYESLKFFHIKKYNELPVFLCMKFNKCPESESVQFFCSKI